jgi:SHS2 domain-containing protein
MKKYEFLKHTADVAACVFGRSLKDLFESAALAMFAVLLEKTKNRPGAVLTEKEISVCGEAPEDLLKAWLDELLFCYSVEHLVLVRIKSIDVDGKEMRAFVLFDAFDGEYYAVKDEIKAVTYHELEVKKVRNSWQAHVIFDV